MFNTDKFRIKTVKRQTLAIILILIAGGTSTAFAVTNGSIITGDLTVTGTCTGCGGGEGSFASYNTIALNTTVASTGNPGFTLIGNDGGVQVMTNAKDFYVALNGTTLFLQTGSSSSTERSDIAQSGTGAYKIMDNEASLGEVDIYKNGNFLQSLGIDLTQFFGGSFGGKTSIAISPDAKYIAVVGPDSGGVNTRVLVFQGAP